MKNIFITVIIILSALVFQKAGTGAENESAGGTILITASRYESSVTREGKDITVITSDDIKKSGKKNLSDLLESVPGVTLTRKGSDVGVANVYIRGGKSGNVLLMIDGVRVSDPMGIEKVFDISGIRTYNIERIEIVKGAMSAMYGAEASGGVINIITKKGAGRNIAITAETGTDRTFSETVLVSDSSERSSFMFSAYHSVSDGESVSKKNGAIPSYDDDGYRNVGASARIETSLDRNMSLRFSMNYTDSKQELDDGSYQDDPNHTYSGRLFSSRGEFKHSPLDWFTWKGGVSYMSYQRSDTDPADSIDTAEYNSSLFDGSNLNGDIIGIVNIFDVSFITLGVDILTEKGESSSAYSASPTIFEEKSVQTRSVFIHNRISISDILFVNAGGRIDSHEVFGNHYTWDTSAALIIPVTGTKLKASAGTGFRAPSLYELYDSYAGNPELEPEKTFVYDAGIFQEFFQGIFSVDCTFFVQRFRNMIEYNYSTWKYYNADGEVKNRGVEVAATLRAGDILTASYGYTYLDYMKTEGETILKRPGHCHSGSVTVKPVEGLSVTGIYLYVGRRYDYLSATSSVKLDSYSKFDMSVRYQVNETFTLTARGENLANENYMETYGYNSKGRSIYGGVEILL